MADYTNSKNAVGETYPENAIETEASKLEPIVGFKEIETRHLFGLPLISQMKDPFTGKPIVMTEDMVKDIVAGAIEQVELMCKIDITPVKRRFKMAFDRNAYESWGFMQLPFRPISSIDKLSVTPANGADIYVVPVDWVETAYLTRGQINIIPMTAAFIQGGYVPAGSTGGAFFLAILGNRGWIPAYWQIECTSGYKDMLVPRAVNELIGTVAAIEILSMLAATYARSQSHSLGIDGLSQSVSTPGPAIFMNRIKDLTDKQIRLTKQLKALYNRKIFSSHV